MQSILYNKEIRLINFHLRKNKVGFLFLKGLLLHLYYQKTYPRRVYADCDILVAKKDKIKVISILQNQGYRKFNDKTYKGIISDDSSKEVGYFKSIKGVRVIFEIHFEPVFMLVKLDINNRFYPQELIDSLTNHFLQNKDEVRFEGMSFNILPKAELVAYLSLHFFHHNYRDIYRLEIIESIIQRFSKKDWTELEKLIKEFKLKNFVYPVFILLKNYYSVSVPESFLLKIHPKNLLINLLIFRVKALVFSSQSRVQIGVERFFLTFLLSPEPLYRRITVFFIPKIWKIAFKLTFRFLRSVL